jgi:3'(2'), 5'-bisphosphate nucleotidase
MFDKELSLAKELAQLAGIEIMKYHKGDFTINKKYDFNFESPLTIADMKANEIIVAGLQKAFDYHILSEESVDDLSRLGKDYVWIVDPLDGTKEFIKGSNEFTVNIALVKNQKVVLGVIYVPCTEEMYFAVQGQGAYFQKDNFQRKLSVTFKNILSDMTLVGSKSHKDEKINKLEKLFNNFVSIGSSLKGCLVAEGKADAYIRFGPTSEWDICAMNCIVNEAGGRMTFIDGEEIKYNRKNIRNKGFIVTNANSYKQILNLLNDD